MGGGGNPSPLSAVASPVSNALLSRSPAFNWSTGPKQVVLADWWLIWVEEEQGGPCRLGVSGFHTGREATRIFKSAPIAKRIDQYTLKTTDDVTVIFEGTVNDKRMWQGGFCDEITSEFLIGFPFNWERCAKKSATNKVPCTRCPNPSDAAMPQRSPQSDGLIARSKAVNHTVESEVLKRTMHDSILQDIPSTQIEIASAEAGKSAEVCNVHGRGEPEATDIMQLDDDEKSKFTKPKMAAPDAHHDGSEKRTPRGRKYAAPVRTYNTRSRASGNKQDSSLRRNGAEDKEQTMLVRKKATAGFSKLL